MGRGLLVKGWVGGGLLACGIAAATAWDTVLRMRGRVCAGVCVGRARKRVWGIVVMKYMVVG